MISRFAPAPTGYLHLGHVLNAAYVWAHRRAAGDRILLRIEDHDRQRSRPQYEAAILDDLVWLGFIWDGPVVRQSERGDIYVRALERLRAQGLVYACACSRTDIAMQAALKGCATDTRAPTCETRAPTSDTRAATSDARARTSDARAATSDMCAPTSVAQAFRPAEPELVYSGVCRDRGLSDGPGMTLRVRLDSAVERFVDLRLGAQEQQPARQCGDIAIRDRDGNWTYQFAATVDDVEQQVTHVIRGEDLLESTGRQIQLARLLGRAEPPLFLHHPLVMKTATQKLSKSDGDTGVRDLRARGWTPRQVLDAATSSIITP